MFKQILCVDDDPITLVILKMLIQKSQFAKHIQTAADGVEAVKLYEDLLAQKQTNPEIDEPAIIFLDLNMPIMGGWDFLDVFTKRFKETFPQTKVVILSSSIDPADIKKADAYEIVAKFVSKPMTIDVLNDLKGLQ